jgi:hypothetical protein
MAVGVQAIYPAEVPGAIPTPFTTANTALDGTGTITAIATAGAKGARLDRIYFKASADIAVAGMIRVFVKASGGTYRLIGEVPVAITAHGANAVTWNDVFTPVGAPMVLAAGCVVGVSTEKNDLFNALPSIGDF